LMDAQISYLDICLQEMDIHFDIEFCLLLLRFWGLFLGDCGFLKSKGSTNFSPLSSLQIPEKILSISPRFYERDDENEISRNSQRKMLYVDIMNIRQIVLNVEVMVGENALAVDFTKMDLPLELGMAYFGTRVFSLFTSVVGSIAHAHPSFHFNDCSVTQFFGTSEKLVSLLTKTYAHQAAKQSIKIFGSLEVLGDPLSMVNEIGGGIIEFVKGPSTFYGGEEGEGGRDASKLAKHVVGSTFGTASRLTGSLANVMRGVVGQENTDHERPTHVMEGISQGSSKFVQDLETGFTGMVREPRKGMEEGGGLGIVTGVVKGVAGMVASPFVATLDALSSVTGGVEAMARNGLEKKLMRRRERRIILGILTEEDMERNLEELFEEEDSEISNEEEDQFLP